MYKARRKTRSLTTRIPLDTFKILEDICNNKYTYTYSRIVVEALELWMKDNHNMLPELSSDELISEEDLQELKDSFSELI